MYNWVKICVVCLVFSHLQCLTLGGEEDWQIFSGRKDVPFDEVKAEIYREFDAFDDDMLKAFYVKNAQAILEPNCVEISFRKKHESDGALIYRGKIHFSKGRLFIHYDHIDQKWLQKQGASECYNYATVDGNLYRWKHVGHNNWKCRFHGHKGEILRRYHGDTSSFLSYFLDWSAIKRCAYRDYLTEDYLDRGLIEAVKKDGMIDIRFYTRDSSHSAIDPNDTRKVLYSVTVGEETAWLFSHSEPGFTTLEFDYPKVIKEIPEGVLKLPKNVEFNKSKPQRCIKSASK